MPKRLDPKRLGAEMVWCRNADTSFVLLDVTCSPRGLVVHMQIFATLKYLILQKKKFKLFKGREGLCGRTRWPASPDIGPLVHTVYSVRTTSHSQKKERGVCNCRNVLLPGPKRPGFLNLLSFSVLPSVVIIYLKCSKGKQGHNSKIL